MITGRIDVHSHLLPGIDDGCETAEESIACAKMLVSCGYTHSFCTPHIHPDFPRQTIDSVKQWTTDLQAKLTAAGVPLTLIPGGEITLKPDLLDQLTDDRLLTYGTFGKYCLVDLWADKLPDFFDPTIKWLQAKGLKVILAHPERMKAVQVQPNLADHFAHLGILLQGNLQCLSDLHGAAPRIVAEKYLQEGRYFLLGSDLHRLKSLPPRMAGLQFAMELVGRDVVDKLTMQNPKLLMENSIPPV
jgi:protein-tyrosine phosphatase